MPPVSIVRMADAGYWFCAACERATELIDGPRGNPVCARCRSPRVEFRPPVFRPEATPPTDADFDFMKTKLADYTIHPAANLFPMLSEKELRELADDIKAHGLLNSIVLLDGKVLDGRNRLAACDMAGVEPRTEEYRGTTPVEYVLAANLKRRHLTASQKAAVAVASLPLLEAEAKERQKKHGNTEDSDGLRQLKYSWMSATEKDKAQFMEWTRTPKR